MKEGADRIARWLKASEHKCVVMHSNLSQKVREQSLKKFKDGDAQILVATDIASRGLDIAHVMHVINYDVQKTVKIMCIVLVEQAGRKKKVMRQP